MEKICVFCGSSMGKGEIYKKEAKHLAEVFYKNNISLVFGGSNIGLMKVMADRLMELGGEVIGIMPHFLADKEIYHKGITKLIKVESMSERKNLMAELSDGFIALPGGLGTLDELMEMMTLSQLRISNKPVSILNTNGYFNSIMDFFNHAVQEGFIRAEHNENFIFSENLEEIIDKMKNYQPVEIVKWIADIKKESSKN